MEKKYLVTGHWTDKTTAKPVSGIVEITGGTNKQGQPYEIANTDSREAPIDGAYPGHCKFICAGKPRSSITRAAQHENKS
jgi:hypothetical protein